MPIDGRMAPNSRFSHRRQISPLESRLESRALQPGVKPSKRPDSAACLEIYPESMIPVRFLSCSFRWHRNRIVLWRNADENGNSVR